MTATKQNNKRLFNILIIDDHKMVREGLKVMLASFNKYLQFKVLEAGNGEDAMTMINRNRVELVIIDYQMPGLSGVETIHQILRFKPAMKILALSNYDEIPCIQSMIDAGARGYVLKNIEPAEMRNAIETILADKIYYCSEVAVKLIESARNEKLKTEKINDILTRREIEVLKMIAMEMTNEEIARKLSVGKRTVDSHRQHLIQKLRVKNTVGLLKIAYKFDLVKS